MSNNRYVESQRYRGLGHQPFLGVEPAFWSGSAVAVFLLVAALYWLLKHGMPV